MSHADASQLDQDKNNNKKKRQEDFLFLSNVPRRHWTLVEKWRWWFPVETMCVYIYIYGHARESSIEDHAQLLV